MSSMVKKSRFSYCGKCRNSQIKTTATIATFTWRQSCATAELSHVPCSIWIISGSQSVRNIWKYSKICSVGRRNICLFDICPVYFHINMFRYSFVPFFHDKYVPYMYLDVMISPRRWRAIVSGQGSWEKMFQWLFFPHQLNFGLVLLLTSEWCALQR